MSPTLHVANAVLDGESVALRADEGRIVALGPDVAPEPGDDRLDAGGMTVLPGLVNGHTHAAMTLFRGFGDDLPLMEWLEQRIWPVEAELTAEDVYWGTRLACVEMLRTGTVRFWDMYWHPEAVARAVEDAGIRATVSMPLIDGLDPARLPEVQATARGVFDALAGAGERVTVSFGPHGIYTVSEATLRWVAEDAAERGAMTHIHCSETEHEVVECVAAHGVRPAAYLDRIGFLNERAILAHGVWLDDDELALVGERGATVVTNPVSNLKLAVGGVFPYARARERGVAVGLGTDGAASNNSLDLFQDVKHLALLQKHTEVDPAAMPATEAWAVATGVRAPRLGQGAPLGIGAPADFLLVERDRPELIPGDLVANLVYAAPGTIVDTTVVAGRVLVRGGEVLDQDLEEIRARVLESAARLGLS